MEYIVKIMQNKDYFYLFNSKSVVYEPLLAKRFKRFDFALRAVQKSFYADYKYEIVEAPPYSAINL